MLWFLPPGVAEEALPGDDWALLRTWLDGQGGDLDRYVTELGRPGALTAALKLVPRQHQRRVVRSVGADAAAPGGLSRARRVVRPGRRMRRGANAGLRRGHRHMVLPPHQRCRTLDPAR